MSRGALEREASQRAAFLAQACQGDDELRREVESLLAQEKPAEGFLEPVAAEACLEVCGEDAGADGEQSMIGRQMGSYQVISLLGAGGMGEVYEARDTKLGRNVAIKVLPAAFVHDPERLVPFSARSAHAGFAESSQHRHDLWPGTVRRRALSGDGTGAGRDAGRAHQAKARCLSKRR